MPACATSAGLKLELNAEANPGRTGAEEVPAAAAAAATAAWRGGTAATEEGDPCSPTKWDNTGLPAGELDPTKPGNPELPDPRELGGRPGKPRPKGDPECVTEGGRPV